MHQREEETSSPRPKGRIGLLDTLKGIGLIAMAHYHFTWDLEMFGYIEPGTATSGWWKIYARSIASTFLFLAGFSLYLAHRRGVNWQSFGRRLGLIGAAAFAITVATVIFIAGAPIFFGILHSIAASSLLGLIFVRSPAPLTLITAIAVILAPQYLTSEFFSHPAFYWLGLAPTPPRSNDYVPLMPWFGVFLLGMAASQISLPRGWLDKFRKPSSDKNIVALFGRHSLKFYLLHQPVLISLVYLFSLVAPPAPIDQVEGYKNSCQLSCVDQGNGVEMCERFCGCTLEFLQARNLFDPMLSQSLNDSQQSEISSIAQECSALSR